MTSRSWAIPGTRGDGVRLKQLQQPSPSSAHQYAIPTADWPQHVAVGNPGPAVHASMATFTTWASDRPHAPVLPTIQMHHGYRAAGCASCERATSDGAAQPRRMASIGGRAVPSWWSRGRVEQLWACWTRASCPFVPDALRSLHPRDAAASSAASNPLSPPRPPAFVRCDAHVDGNGPEPAASSATRQALTVALVKPVRGSRAYQAKNSSRPGCRPFRDREETLSRTRPLICASPSRGLQLLSIHFMPLNGNIEAIWTLPRAGKDIKSILVGFDEPTVEPRTTV